MYIYIYINNTRAASPPSPGLSAGSPGSLAGDPDPGPFAVALSLRNIHWLCLDPCSTGPLMASCNAVYTWSRKLWDIVENAFEVLR